MMIISYLTPKIITGINLTDHCYVIILYSYLYGISTFGNSRLFFFHICTWKSTFTFGQW
jgi:hypothetical protein